MFPATLAMVYIPYTMRNLNLIIFLLFIRMANGSAQQPAQRIITSDIDRFWNAYDKMKTTNDSSKQVQYLNEDFIIPGTAGLKAIMQARNYTVQSYWQAIKRYPLFWESVRSNTLKASLFAKDIDQDIEKIKVIYPKLKPAEIYFTIGALLTNGTTLNHQVLIGSELALANQNTVTSEFPANLSHLKSYFKTNPINDVVFLNVHEYVHTQQKTTVGSNLLTQCLLEGVAEFVAVKASGKTSPNPSIAFGKMYEDQVRDRFSREMFFPDYTGYWLYSNADNEFKIRDLGYYVGYAICEKYYEKAKDKKKAIRDMIELDYHDQLQVQRFVDRSAYFQEQLAVLNKTFESKRPVVTGIREFKNGANHVDPRITTLTVQFSIPMDPNRRNFDFGPLGEPHALRLKKFTGFGGDKKSVSFEISMQPGQRYQILVGSGFRDEKGLPLKPYLIDFTTATP